MQACEVAAKPPQGVPVMEGLAGKYLVFQLGTEEFCIPVSMVREIISIQDVTTVPQTPSHVKGVINLRGKVIPVVSLRLRFGIEEIAYTQRTCIVVVQVRAGSEALHMGVVVDSVVEVLNVVAGEIEPTPDFGDGVSLSYLMGMAKIKDKVKMLLDIEQVLGGSEVRALSALVQNMESGVMQ